MSSTRSKGRGDAAGRTEPLNQQSLELDVRGVGELGAETIVLTSNFEIGALLSRGLLLPPSVEREPGEAEAPAPWPSSLRRLAARTASTEVDCILQSGRNAVPIGIRLKSGRAVRRVAAGAGGELLEAIVLSDARGLVFRSEEEKERFTGMEFADYSLEGLDLSVQVSPELFGGAIGPGSGEQGPAEAPDSGRLAEGGDGPPALLDSELLEPLRKRLRRADALGGLVAVLAKDAPCSAPWMRGLQRLVGKDMAGQTREKNWPEFLGRAISGPGAHLPEGADEILVQAAVAVSLRHPEALGWPAEEIVAEIEREAKSNPAAETGGLAGEISTWARRARSVLNADSEPTSLADDSMVGQRAVVFLLLRGSIEALHSTDSSGPRSTLQVGRDVRALACCLAGIRSGLRSLPWEYKVGGTRRLPKEWLCYLGELVLDSLASDGGSVAEPGLSHRIQVGNQRFGALRGEWTLSVDGTQIFRGPEDFDTGLTFVHSTGRDLGFDFEEHGELGLVTRIDLPNGRRQPVYVTLKKRSRSEDHVVRFSSPTLALRGKYARSRLQKDFLFDLLERNARPEVDCRFGIDGDEVVVIVDQLFQTLDRPEFRKHVDHVARVADEYERDKGLDEYR